MVLVLKTSHWCRFHSFFLSISISPVLWHKCQRVFSWANFTSPRHAGSFACSITSLILITMDNGTGHCPWWQSCKVPNQTQTGIKNGKCMLWKKLRCVQNTGTSYPGLGWIYQAHQDSWQTSLGLGSMSRYSAQILICTPTFAKMFVFKYVHNYVINRTYITRQGYGWILRFVIAKLNVIIGLYLLWNDHYFLKLEGYLLQTHIHKCLKHPCWILQNSKFDDISFAKDAHI